MFLGNGREAIHPHLGRACTELHPVMGKILHSVYPYSQLKLLSGRLRWVNCVSSWKNIHKPLRPFMGLLGLHAPCSVLNTRTDPRTHSRTRGCPWRTPQIPHPCNRRTAAARQSFPIKRGVRSDNLQQGWRTLLPQGSPLSSRHITAQLSSLCRVPANKCKDDWLHLHSYCD